MVPYTQVIGLALILFVLALALVLTRRSLLALLAGVQGVFTSLCLALLGFVRMHAAGGGAVSEAYGFALIILVVAAAELALGLSIGVAFVRRRRSVNVENASVLRW
ncbi:MAG: NADH-quinone oxidoreductase subunit K [Myxococcota bacterium]|nr:NADH-quinone oxidoreductase subunit K [Myxococcota bacterium]